ncbi:carboxypeptidase regulatory-like domain-containing protein [Paenibacillus luteus]|uniref:carboxypeptidase regulatory-like domain-containing protein n=1 Tax=Paenibacillus luteus TaxID=2545753 RepID=UPI0013764762|nr:carboxypeptidase regulatory-like domain-containing protein [Paenibacillus luteus]
MQLKVASKKVFVSGFIVLALLFSLLSSAAFASSGEGTVTGVIQSYETKLPLDGVEVKVYSGSDGVNGTLVNTVITDVNGTYTFTNVPVGKFYLSFKKTGYLPVILLPNGNTVVPGNTTQIMPFELTFSEVYGTIKDTQGAEIGGVTVRITETGTAHQLTTSESVGFFSLNNVPYGTYTLTVSKAGYQTLTTSSFPVNTGEYTSLGDIVLLSEGANPPAKTLDELIANPQQLEVQVGKTATAEITALYSDDSSAKVTARVSWTTSEPSIVEVSNAGLIVGVKEGDGATITATFEGKSVSIPVVVTSATEPLGTGAVKGTISDLVTYGALSNASVSLYTGTYPGTLVETVLTDLNGAYSFENVPVGVFELVVEKVGYVKLSLSPNQNVVIENETTKVPDVILFNSQLFGEIQGRDNENISNANVVINGTELKTSTSNGFFAFFNIPDGTYTLTITKSGYEDYTTNSFTIVQGQSIRLETIRMIYDAPIGGGGGATTPTPSPTPESTPDPTTPTSPVSTPTTPESTPTIPVSTPTTPESTPTSPVTAPTIPAATPAPTPTPESKPEKPVLDEKVVKVEAVKEKIKTAIEASTTTAFKDVEKNSWSANSIELAAKLGFVSGYQDGSFHAEASVTRAEFATMLVKALGIETTATDSFGDTKGHWASSAISALKSAGIIGGYEDGSFKPNHEITRAEMVTMLSKLMNLSSVLGSAKFQDVSGNWAEAGINQLADAGIISGKGEGKFEPNATATRAESVVMILRMLNVTLELGLDLS